MNCIKIIYKEENGKVTINEVDKYINKQGIWALFGKREDIFECLNVGKCIDVGREILYDISCLHNILLHKEGNEEYINQFAELCNFKYRKKWTQEYLYQYISRLRYEVIAFVYILPDRSYPARAVISRLLPFREKEVRFPYFCRNNNNSIKTVRFHFPPERMWKDSYAIICMYQRIISFHTYRFFHGGTHLWKFYRQKT